MRLEEFIRKAIERRGVYKHRHVEVKTGNSSIIIQDYETTIAIADRISRIALIDAEHYSVTTAKTFTYVLRALFEKNYSIYEAPYIEEEPLDKFDLTHRYDTINNQPIHMILQQNERGTRSILHIYNWYLLRKGLKKRAFIYSKEEIRTKKLFEFPTIEEIPPLPFNIELLKEPPKKFEFISKGIPATIDDFRPQSKLDKLNEELFLTIDHLISKNIIKFTRFLVLDDNTLIIRRTGGLLRKFSNFEKIRINYDATDYSIIIPKINHISIPLLPFK